MGDLNFFLLQKTPLSHRPLETTSEIPQEVIPGSTLTPLKEAACFGHLKCADDLLKTAEEAAEAFHKPHGIRLRKTGKYIFLSCLWSICNMYLHLDDFFMVHVGKYILMGNKDLAKDMSQDKTATKKGIKVQTSMEYDWKLQTCSKMFFFMIIHI